MKKVFKRFTATHVLLILIAMILFFGLFKTEIKAWKYQNWPEFRERTVDAQGTCSVLETNPAYTANEEKRVRDCSVKDNSNMFGITADCMADNALRPIEKIIVNKPCIVQKKETWFWALGKWWFKK